MAELAGGTPKGTRYPTTVTLIELGVPLEVYTVTFKLTHGKYPSTFKLLWEGSVSGFDPVLMVHGFVPGQAGPSVVHEVPGAPLLSLVPSKLMVNADMLSALYVIDQETQGLPVLVDNAGRAAVRPVVPITNANWQSGIVEL